MEIGHRQGWAAAEVGKVSFASDPALGRTERLPEGDVNSEFGEDPCLDGKRDIFGTKHLPGERAALGLVPRRGGTGHTCCLRAGEAEGCPAQQKGEAFWGRAAYRHLSIRVLSFLAHISFILIIFHFYRRFLPFILSVAQVPAFSTPLAQPALVVATSRARLACWLLLSVAKAVLLCYHCSWH